jgi:hypothetical protein
MICFPMAIDVSAGNVYIVLLNENQVPQKTPVTSTSITPVMSSKIFRSI